MDQNQNNEIHDAENHEEIQEIKQNDQNTNSEQFQNEYTGRRSSLPIQVTLPILRESQLPQIFPLSNVFVSFPKAQKSFIKSVMYYKIDFEWNGQKKSIERRYSDIQNLREAFVSLLPFTYICAIHRKQIMVNL